MNTPAALPDGHALAECYEALRQDAVGSGGRKLIGRAALMFKGMATWMKSLGEASVSPRRSLTVRDEKRLPVSFEQNVVDIIATMALATTLAGQA